MVYRRNRKSRHNGIIPDELNTLHRINEILEADGKTNSGFVDQLSEYLWLYDGVNDNEYFALIELRRLLEIDGTTNSGTVERLSKHTWIADDITAKPAGQAVGG